MKATFLKPTWKEARTSKVYAIKDNVPTIINPYNLGKTFEYAVATFQTIFEFKNILAQCADKKVIRIAGTPIPNGNGAATSTTHVVRRTKENFSDSGTQVLLLDADDWDVPLEGSLKSPGEIRDTIQLMLSRMGFSFLHGVQFCVLFSNSYWDVRKLRAHIYFLIDKPVPLATLHSWGLAHNSLGPDNKLDYSLFRQVQPDFISKRICQGFSDPLSDALRLTAHCDSLSPYVSQVALMEHISRTVKEAGIYTPVNAGGDSTQDRIGTNWEESLKMCGTAQHGINDPAYRACAQLVQEVGSLTIESNLPHYVDKVFTQVWQNVAQHGVRGGKKDRDYYNKERFKGYITTAIAKSFGADSDTKVKAIAEVLKKIIGGASVALLFDHDVVEDMRVVRTKMPGKWAMLKNIIKTKLKGKVTVSDIEQSMGGLKTGQDMSAMIDQVVKRFKWIEGSIDQGLYCRSETGTNYSVVGLDSGVENDIYTKALEMFDNVPHMFEKNVLKVLIAKARNPTTTSFVKTPVESRCHTELHDGENTLYLNLGSVGGGDMRTAVVTDAGVEIKHSSKVPVTWTTAAQTLPCEVSDPAEVEGFMGADTKQYFINAYLKGMEEFTSVEDDESLTDLIAWQLTALLNTGTSTLLEITGASEDGKSSTALFTKELIDPTSSSVRNGPDLHNGMYKKEDLAKILRSRHITIIDNLSNLKPNEQDLLCSIATGWKYDLRMMYTQQFLNLVIKKPLILTALSPVITNQDLRSRSISVSVSRKRKRSGGDIYARWDQEKGMMLTGVLYLASDVLRYVNGKRAEGANLNSRDMWSVAARTVLMEQLGTFNTRAEIQAYILKRKGMRNITEALLNSRAAVLVLWVMYSETFEKRVKVILTVTDLYYSLKKFAYERAGDKLLVDRHLIEVAPEFISNTPRAMGSALSRYCHDIAAATGWDLEHLPRSRGRGWQFTPPPKVVRKSTTHVVNVEELKN